MQENVYIEVKKAPAATGALDIQGSKNSALGVVAAACLHDDRVELKNIPDLRDFRIIREMLNKVNITFEKNEQFSTIDSRKCRASVLDYAITADFRASYYFIAPILQRFNQVTLAFPGGDDFGSRPIDQHFKGIRQLGGRIEEHGSTYTVYAEALKGAEVHFDLLTSGATINVMMIATLAEGTTVLKNCATDPEVVDVANFLNLMGHNIKGAGTSKITIVPGEKVAKPLNYTVIPDRLIAGSFLMLPGIVGGEILVKNGIHEHLESLLSLLSDMGLEITVSEEGIRSRKVGPLKGVRCVTGMYPLFATDLQQPLTALMLYANSPSSVQDNVYPKRFAHVAELEKMHAAVTVDVNVASIEANQGAFLQGADVNARDVRAGTCMLFAALGTNGTTRIHDVKHIFRGYEDLVGDLAKVGITVELKTKELPDEEIKNVEA